MNTPTLEQIEYAYGRTLARIGTLQEIAEIESAQQQQNSDTLEALESATERACALARMLGTTYDAAYDA